jgi:hypothetical protein
MFYSRNLPTNTQTINRLESQKENMFHSKYRSKTALGKSEIKIIYFS